MDQNIDTPDSPILKKKRTFHRLKPEILGFLLLLTCKPFITPPPNIQTFHLIITELQIKTARDFNNL